MASEDDFDLADFEDVASVLRAGPSDVVPENPPAELWSRIEAAIADESTQGRRILADASPTWDATAGEGAVAPVTSLQSRRRAKPIGVLVGIAAALVLLGVPLGLAIRSNQSDPVFTAELAALPDYAGMGNAEVDDGKLHVVVDGLPEAEPGSRYELWLLDVEDEGVEALHWVGVIDEVDGQWALPADLDLLEFDVVDISVELDDGDTEHSGLSVLRGELS